MIISLCGCYGKNPTVKTGLEGKQMPAIDILSIDSIHHFNTNNISTGRPIVLFVFETWCPYCRAQTQSLLTNSKNLDGILFLMICKSPYKEFKHFYQKYKLNQYPNIVSGVDYNAAFANYFQTDKVPLIAFYDNHKNLKQVLLGKQYINTIKEITSE
jgi:thiol-disulfide isomerase/thioredoxin